jgi:hypothetical protein
MPIRGYRPLQSNFSLLPAQHRHLVVMPSSTLSLAYESSSEDDEAEIKAPPAKRKKLPVLSPNLVVPIPQDDPALHQGRARSSPFVEGQWAAYVYIPVRLDVSSRLNGVLASALQAAQSQVPSLHPIGIPPSRQYTSSLLEPRRGNEELHISLSRPIYLRSHQREDLKQAVRTLASRTSPYGHPCGAPSAVSADDSIAFKLRSRPSPHLRTTIRRGSFLPLR